MKNGTEIRPTVFLAIGGVLIATGLYFSNNVSHASYADGVGFKAAPVTDTVQAILPLVLGLLTIIKPLWPYVEPLIFRKIKEILPIDPKDAIAAILRLRGVLVNEHPELYAVLKKELDVMFDFLGYKPAQPPVETGVSDDQVLKLILQIERLKNQVQA